MEIKVTDYTICPTVLGESIEIERFYNMVLLSIRRQLNVQTRAF